MINNLISTTISTPLWLLGIVFFIAMASTVILVIFFMDIKRFAPEALIYKAARKKNLPILMVHDTSGRVEMLLGKKKKKGDFSYTKEETGVYLDTTLTGSPPEDRTFDGVRIYHYSTSFPFPISSKNARGLTGIIRHVRENHKVLNQFTDLEIIELLGTDASELVQDCENLIKSYELKPQDFNISIDPQAQELIVIGAIAEEVARLIHQIQSETSTMPLDTKFFSYTHAFKLIPSAFLSQDVLQLKNLIERLIREESSERMKEFLMYGTFILMVLVGAGIAYKLISGS